MVCKPYTITSHKLLRKSSFVQGFYSKPCMYKKKATKKEKTVDWRSFKMQQNSKGNEWILHHTCKINMKWSSVCDNEQNVNSQNCRRRHQRNEWSCKNTCFMDVQAVKSSKAGNSERCSFTWKLMGLGWYGIDLWEDLFAFWLTQSCQQY